MLVVSRYKSLQYTKQLKLNYYSGDFLDKELIDQNTRDIEMLKNKPPVEIPEMPDVGDGLNMAQLMNIFASKNPPDSTIVRIEELEKQVKDLMAREPVKEIREIKEVRTEVQA